jgi:hypothetical protein
MGCNCTREDKVITGNQLKGNKVYIIRVNIPNSNSQKCIFVDKKEEYAMLSEVVNYAFFCSDQANELDANFISIYNQEKDCFNYYIQRIIGYEIENDDNPEVGKLWIPYINKEKSNWSQICGNNRIIKRSDEIEFIYETEGYK